jgi:mannose-1-phosphate guanylyltransferase/mannose-1-phosphate guanylyltransferase/mannose-6-phosphate isomerase
LRKSFPKQFAAIDCDHSLLQLIVMRLAGNGAKADPEAGKIVTFGITPDRAETGYGYLELGGEPIAGRTASLTRFVEKPDRATAD